MDAHFCTSSISCLALSASARSRSSCSDFWIRSCSLFSISIVSRKTILKNHPFVEDADDEIKQLEKEEKQMQMKENEYARVFQKEETEGTDNEDSIDSGNAVQDKKETV